MGIECDTVKAVLSSDIVNINSENNDIRFIIRRSDDYLPDAAFVSVYNLNRNLLSSILNRNISSILSVFVGISDITPLLLFRGSLIPFGVKNNIKNIKAELEYTTDMCSSFTLVEAFDFYSKFVEITYPGEVSAFSIIKDCAHETTLDDVIFSDTVPDITYQSYKAVGKASVIIKQICKTLNTAFYIKNNILYVGSSADKPLLIPFLNSSNSTNPVYLGSNLYKLYTNYNPDIKIGSSLEVSFSGVLDGIFKVHQLLISGDTAKNFIEMTVIIGI